MSHEHASPESEMNEIEAALGSLAPARGGIDRDRILFRAGQASTRKPSGRHAWMAVAASFALVAVGEGALLAHRAPPQVVERLVVIREPAAPPSGLVTIPPPAIESRPLEAGPGARARLEWQVLRYGLDGLPAPLFSAGNDAGPIPPRQLLRDELLKVLEPGDHS